MVKADGLAAGKGVVVAATSPRRRRRSSDVDGALRPAGERSSIEEFLDGEEASLFALCDGDTALAIGTAQDHKRAFDGDRGPNTGGMGAYSPAPALDARHGRARRWREIVRPTLAGMAARGRAVHRGSSTPG